MKIRETISNNLNEFYPGYDPEYSIFRHNLGYIDRVISTVSIENL